MATTSAILTQAAFCVLAIVLVLLVARVQKGRFISEESRSPLRSFVVWWLIIAAYYMEQLLFNLSRMVMEWNATALLALTILEVAMVITAFGFLLDYLLFIVQGTTKWRRAIQVYYIGLFLLMAIIGPLTGPYTVKESPTGPSIEGEVPIVGVMVLMFMLVPVVLALILKVRLWFAAKDSTTRYRLGMITLSVLFFVVVLSINDVVPADFEWGNPDGDAHIIIQGGGLIFMGVLPVIGAWLAYRAYKPAAWVEKHFGIQELRT